MNSRQKEHNEQFKRAVKFGRDHAEAFKGKSPKSLPSKSLQLFEELQLVVGQMSNGGVKPAEEAPDKETLRAALMAELKSIHTTVKSIASERCTPAIITRFRLVSGKCDEQLSARALGFCEAMEELSLLDEMVALNHSPDVIASLQAQAEQFTTAPERSDEPRKAPADNGLDPLVARGVLILEALHALVLDKFKDSPETLGAWKTASRS
jgi:hypothetical protein